MAKTRSVELEIWFREEGIADPNEGWIRYKLGPRPQPKTQYGVSMNESEIAKALNITPGCVHSTLANALKKLRKNCGGLLPKRRQKPA